MPHLPIGQQAARSADERASSQAQSSRSEVGSAQPQRGTGSSANRTDAGRRQEVGVADPARALDSASGGVGRPGERLPAPTPAISQGTNAASTAHSVHAGVRRPADVIEITDGEPDVQVCNLLQLPDRRF